MDIAFRPAAVQDTSLLEFLTDLAPLLTLGVLIATAIIAWRVQLKILARRTAWDYIANHQLRSDYLNIQSAAILALIEKPWERAEGFVHALRNTERGYPALYGEFERLATSIRFRQIANYDDDRSKDASS